jgi:hypothetical protein
MLQQEVPCEHRYAGYFAYPFLNKQRGEGAEMISKKGVTIL